MFQGVHLQSKGGIVETTDFDGAGHAVETMDEESEAPELLSEDIP